MRYQYLDILRGICIVLMILFHLNYSLVNIFGSEIINFSQYFWYIVGKISALGFMIISWVSFYLAKQKYSEQDLRNKYFKYAWVLALIALGITLVTYFFIPEQLILFGILHLFAVSFFLLVFVSKLGYYCGIVAGMLIFLWLIFPVSVENRFLFPFWFTHSEFYSADYYPLIPYFWYILWWYFIALLSDRYNFLRYLRVERDLYFVEALTARIGKYSLIIYLIHQPIIITLLYIMLRFQDFLPYVS